MRGVAKQERIPASLSEHSLNLRAYIDLPSRDVSIEDEVRRVIDQSRTRMIGPEEATRQILGIIGREQAQFEEAVKAAL